MNGTCREAAMAMTRSAVISAWVSFSIAQGPPMSTSGRWLPIVTPPTVTARVMLTKPGRAGRDAGGPPTAVAGCRRLSLVAPVVEGRFHEAGEEGVGIPRARAELGVELTGHEVGMVRQLDDLDQLLLGPDPGDREPVLLEALEIVVVDLVAVSVPFLDDPLPVEPRGARPLGQEDRIQAQPHGPALVRERALLGQQIDHEVRGVGDELRGVGSGQAAHVTGVLDHRALHAEADAEVRHAFFARVADGLDLALDAPVAEAARHQDAVHVAEV